MPRKPAATPTHSTDNVISRRVLVNIVRDQTTHTPRVVWAHEVPILEAIFTQCKQVPAETLDEGFVEKPTADLMPFNKTAERNRRPSESLGLGFAFLGDPEAEYERLRAAYGRDPEKGGFWVEEIYGRFSTGVFERVLGKPTVEDLPEMQLREQIMAHGFSIPQPSYEASESERKAAQAQWAKWQAMTRDELVKMSVEYGVEFD